MCQIACVDVCSPNIEIIMAFRNPYLATRKYWFMMLLMTSLGVTAQQPASVADPHIDIPPLAVLIDSALVHSPLLKKYDVNLSIKDITLDLQRMQWMDYLYVEGNTRYGVYDQVYFQGLYDQEELPVGFVNQREQTWYYAGVSLKLPLTTFIGQRKRLQQTRIAFDMIAWEREVAAEEIQKAVIQAYYELLFREESMKTFFGIYQDLKIAYIDSNNRLQEQKIGFNDFAIISSTYGKAKNDYDLARSEFLTSLSLLRFMTGWDF